MRFNLDVELVLVDLQLGREWRDHVRLALVGVRIRGVTPSTPANQRALSELTFPLCTRWSESPPLRARRGAAFAGAAERIVPNHTSASLYTTAPLLLTTTSAAARAGGDLLVQLLQLRGHDRRGIRDPARRALPRSAGRVGPGRASAASPPRARSGPRARTARRSRRVAESRRALRLVPRSRGTPAAMPSRITWPNGSGVTEA